MEFGVGFFGQRIDREPGCWLGMGRQVLERGR